MEHGMPAFKPQEALPGATADADSENITADICVIGAGPGGLAVAAAAAAFGRSVVLIERHKVRARLAILVNLGSAVQNALVNMRQALLKNRLLLLRLTSQSFDFSLNNLFRHGSDGFFDLRLHLMQRPH